MSTQFRILIKLPVKYSRDQILVHVHARFIEKYTTSAFMTHCLYQSIINELELNSTVCIVAI